MLNIKYSLHLYLPFYLFPSIFLSISIIYLSIYPSFHLESRIYRTRHCPLWNPKGRKDCWTVSPAVDERLERMDCSSNNLNPSILNVMMGSHFVTLAMLVLQKKSFLIYYAYTDCWIIHPKFVFLYKDAATLNFSMHPMSPSKQSEFSLYSDVCPYCKNNGLHPCSPLNNYFIL